MFNLFVRVSEVVAIAVAGVSLVLVAQYVLVRLGRRHGRDDVIAGLIKRPDYRWTKADESLHASADARRAAASKALRESLRIATKDDGRGRYRVVK